MSSHLEKYFDQRVKNIFNHLYDFEVTGEENAMHDFRVEMKKLRSIIKFLRVVYPKHQLKKAAHSLRNVFHEAGVIREYQVLQQWLEKNELLVIEATYFPRDEQQKMIEAFRENTKDYQKQLEEVIDHVKVFINSTKEILYEQYLVDLHAQLDDFCNKDLAKEQWHEMRKVIKQWMYALNWVDNDEDKKDKDFPYYNKLQEVIGQWHDLEMFKQEFADKQIYLSQDIEVQKDFSMGWEKLNTSIKQKEKQVEELLAKEPQEEH